LQEVHKTTIVEENENQAPSERLSQQNEFIRQVTGSIKTPNSEDIEVFNPYSN
jgi:hypothetical protein